MGGRGRGEAWNHRVSGARQWEGRGCRQLPFRRVRGWSGAGGRGQGPGQGSASDVLPLERPPHTVPSQSLSSPSLALPGTPALPASKVMRCSGRDCRGLPVRVKMANPHHEIPHPLRVPGVSGPPGKRCRVLSAWATLQTAPVGFVGSQQDRGCAPWQPLHGDNVPLFSHLLWPLQQDQCPCSSAAPLTYSGKRIPGC